jgi:hypothetical protein
MAKAATPPMKRPPTMLGFLLPALLTVVVGVAVLEVPEVESVDTEWVL